MHDVSHLCHNCLIPSSRLFCIIMFIMAITGSYLQNAHITAPKVILLSTACLGLFSALSIDLDVPCYCRCRSRLGLLAPYFSNCLPLSSWSTLLCGEEKRRRDSCRYAYPSWEEIILACWVTLRIPCDSKYAQVASSALSLQRLSGSLRPQLSWLKDCLHWDQVEVDLHLRHLTIYIFWWVIDALQGFASPIYVV